MANNIFKKSAKRFLFFVFIFVSGIFFHWSVTAIFAGLFAVFYYFPIELVALGVFLDSLFFASAPNLFVFGFLAIAASSEFLKNIIERQSWFGKCVIFMGETAVFLIILFLFNRA